MSQYILILIWPAIVLVIMRSTNVYRNELVLGKRELRVVPVFAVITCLPLLIMTATRGGVADTGLYLHLYKQMPVSLSAIPSYIGTINKDKGFSLLSAVIHVIFGNREVVYLGIVGALQCALLINVYRRYSSNFLMSFFLFVVSTDYVSWMFNGMRQFCAVLIVFAATKFMLEKKWMPTILLILLASTMHQSALLMLPIVFIVQGKAWNKRSLFFLFTALVAVVFVDQFTDILDGMMQETQYANMVSDWKSWDDDGTNVIRVLVYAVPTILSVIGLKYIRNADDRVINLCTNMSVVSTGLYIVSMFTSGIFIGRLPIYASLYNYILMPWLIDNMFEKKSATIMKYLMIGAYLLFYYYQMHITWNFI